MRLSSRPRNKKGAIMKTLAKVFICVAAVLASVNIVGVAVSILHGQIASAVICGVGSIACGVSIGQAAAVISDEKGKS